MRLSDFCSRLIYEPTPEQLAKLPRLYETEKVPLKDKPIYIHFFVGDCDWFVSEYDGDDLFFGYATLGDQNFGEWGYISFAELKNIRIPPGIQIDCEFFDLPLEALEIKEIRIR